jgi:phosphoribosylformylglycinamidine synthase subunit PurQ / glutaminase
MTAVHAGASPVRFGVVVFPGSNTDADCHHALGTFPGVTAEYLWHKDTDLKGVDGVVLPGGFSYGDYLRCGAIARFSPIMQSVAEFAAQGGLVMGICNGFHTLCEAGLLPGVLIRNTGLQFICRYVDLKVDNTATPFTSACADGELLRIVVKHNEGNYQVDPQTLQQMKANGQVILRYADARGEVTAQANPNGATDNIAGVCNQTHNVFGMMPHPENSVEAAVAGGTSGRLLFQSMIDTLRERAS